MGWSSITSEPSIEMLQHPATHIFSVLRLAEPELVLNGSARALSWYSPVIFSWIDHKLDPLLSTRSSFPLQRPPEPNSLTQWHALIQLPVDNQHGCRDASCHMNWAELPFGRTVEVPWDHLTNCNGDSDRDLVGEPSPAPGSVAG